MQESISMTRELPKMVIYSPHSNINLEKTYQLSFWVLPVLNVQIQYFSPCPASCPGPAASRRCLLCASSSGQLLPIHPNCYKTQFQELGFAEYTYNQQILPLFKKKGPSLIYVKCTKMSSNLMFLNMLHGKLKLKCCQKRKWVNLSETD